MANETILVVDDEYSFVEFARMLLEADGYRVLTALDGEKALALATAAKPDLVIVDYMMPHLNGSELIRALRADPETKQIPVLLCSITRRREQLEDALAAGAVGFLPKPLKRVELSFQVQRAFKRAGEQNP